MQNFHARDILTSVKKKFSMRKWRSEKIRSFLKQKSESQSKTLQWDKQIRSIIRSFQHDIFNHVSNSYCYCVAVSTTLISTYFYIMMHTYKNNEKTSQLSSFFEFLNVLLYIDDSYCHTDLHDHTVISMWYFTFVWDC